MSTRKRGGTTETWRQVGKGKSGFLLQCVVAGILVILLSPCAWAETIQ